MIFVVYFLDEGRPIMVATFLMESDAKSFAKRQKYGGLEVKEVEGCSIELLSIRNKLEYQQQENTQ
jgi:hypothetical protein